MSISVSGQSHVLSVTSAAIPVHLGEPALRPVRLSGHEGINSLFDYELLLKTPDALNLGASGAADFDLNAFIGREIGCSIELDGSGAFTPGVVGASGERIGAGVRQINALIADAAFLGEEGRHLQYRLTLRPWLHLARGRTNCKIFQNQSVVDILDELLADYPFAVDKRLFGPGGELGDSYPQLDFQTQYNEADFAFFERLCQEWGISYHFEHSEGKHRLVLSDAMGAYRKNPSAAYQHIDYHAPGWKLDAEYISSFVPLSQLTSGRYSTTDYDYTRPRADLRQSRHDPRPTGQADGEVYEWHAAQAGSAASHYAQTQAGSGEPAQPQPQGRFLAQLRMQQLRTHGHRAKASGNLRAMVPGCTFALCKHPRAQANTNYLILETRFLIEDVAQDSQARDAVAERAQQWRVSVELTAHPVTEPLRPAPTRAKPHTHGPQTALVVGPPGRNTWTDKYGRIKVQFHWDRLGQKNQHSSCWVRVASAWSGNQMGASHIPRIGQEVIVDFEGGDPDLPLCTGRVHNQLNLPAWRLPEQSALSGFRSRELTQEGGNSAAGRSNHLLLDDTEGKIQAQLQSDHQHSSLSLGYITRVEDNAGRKEARGEGFELATHGHGVLRARDGLLISTETGSPARAHAKEMGETVRRLRQARAQHEAHFEAARQAKAQGRGDQDEVVRALKGQNDEVQGKQSPAGDGQASEGKFPELSEPHLTLSSPAGIQTSTAGSTHLSSSEHTALTSGGHTSISSGDSLLAVALQAIKLFAAQNRIQVVAAQADVEIQALRTCIRMAAKKEIHFEADVIRINAKTEVRINGGGSYAVFKTGRITLGTAGSYTNHSAAHQFVGPDNAPVPTFNNVPEPDKFKKGLVIALTSHVAQGWALANEPYKLFKDGALVEHGITDAAGQAHIDQHTAGSVGQYRIVMHQGQVFDVPVHRNFGEAANVHALRQASRGHREPEGDAS